MGVFQMVPGWSASSQGHDMPDAAPGTSNEPSSEVLQDQADQADLLAGLENLQRENKTLQRKFEYAREAATLARRAQLIGEEKIRRQNELLQESRQAADVSVQKHSQLLIKLNELQKWTDSIDDDDAVRVMRRLFQRLEDWIKRHYSQPRAAHPTRDNSCDLAFSRMNESYCTIQTIQGFISEQIFQVILSRFMVGIRDRSLENLFYAMDTEVRRTSPSHVWQHWRSSTSLAAASLAKGALDQTCDKIAQRVEEHVRLYTLTNSKERAEQFEGLLQECVEFKLRLERQGLGYRFHRSGPWTLFHQEQMRSLNGVSSAEGKVLQSIWPMLWKGTPENSIIVEKEVVQLIQESPDPTETESDFPAEFARLAL